MEAQASSIVNHSCLHDNTASSMTNRNTGRVEKMLRTFLNSTLGQGPPQAVEGAKRVSETGQGGTAPGNGFPSSWEETYHGLGPKDTHL